VRLTRPPSSRFPSEALPGSSQVPAGQEADQQARVGSVEAAAESLSEPVEVAAAMAEQGQQEAASLPKAVAVVAAELEAPAPVVAASGFAAAEQLVEATLAEASPAPGSKEQEASFLVEERESAPERARLQGRISLR
jgi:hypothetical protein